MAKKMKLRVSPRLLRKRARRSGYRNKKHCRFEGNPELAASIDYKNTGLLRSFITERGKILPARISGNSAYYQRQVVKEIKKARAMALLPYTTYQA